MPEELLTTHLAVSHDKKVRAIFTQLGRISYLNNNEILAIPLSPITLQVITEKGSEFSITFPKEVRVSNLSVSSDGKYILYTLSNGGLKLLDLTTRKLISTPKAFENLSLLKKWTDLEELIQREQRIEQINQFFEQGELGYVEILAISSDFQNIIAKVYSKTDTTLVQITVYTRSEGTKYKTDTTLYSEEPECVRCEFSPNGRFLVLSDYSNKSRVYNTQTWKIILTRSSTTNFSFDFAADEHILALSETHHCEIFDLRFDALIHKIKTTQFIKKTYLDTETLYLLVSRSESEPDGYTVLESYPVDLTSPYLKTLRILQKITPDIPMTLTRLSELTKMERSEIEKIAIAISKKESIGRYYPLEQIFFRTTSNDEELEQAFTEWLNSSTQK